MARAIPLAVFIISLVVAWLIWPRAVRQIASKPQSEGKADAGLNRPPGRRPAGGGPSSAGGQAQVGAHDRASRQISEDQFPIAAPLNKTGSTIARDLDTLSQLLDAWRTNFPREGNPVGENAEITAALTGDNPLGLALIPKNHPAINARGELCDRWGTPFRFHQLSGERMELRSAGPDQKFATGDDVVWNPAP